MVQQIFNAIPGIFWRSGIISDSPETAIQSFSAAISLPDTLDSSFPELVERFLGYQRVGDYAGSAAWTLWHLAIHSHLEWHGFSEAKSPYLAIKIVSFLD